MNCSNYAVPSIVIPGGGGIMLTNPVQYQGTISVAADFPTRIAVQQGWLYKVIEDVTDNDPTKTNTGDSFVAGEYIIWNGTDWDIDSAAIPTLDQVVTAGATTMQMASFGNIIDTGLSNNNIVGTNGSKKLVSIGSIPSGAFVGTTDSQTLTNKDIPQLTNLVTDGFVKTTSGNGTLIIDTNTYITGNQTITFSPSGDVTGTTTGTTTLSPVLSIGANKVTTTTINNSAVTYAKIQDVSAVSLLGNPAGSGGPLSEITLGSGLSFVGGQLVSTGSGGSVTTISVTTANGFAGTVANATSTPAITISTTISGILKGNSTAISAATTNTDYIAPSGAIFSGDVSLGSHKLTNVTDPTNPQDGATKAYVDAIAQGLSVKPSAIAATTTVLPNYIYLNGVLGVGATITALATGVLTIDGYTVMLNDYILVKNETSSNAPYNGLYKCTVAGSIGVLFVLTRAVEMDSSTEFSGSFVFVEQGTINGGGGFVCTNTGSVTVGMTNISFTQFSGTGEITAGNGLSKTGNTLSIDTTITIDKTTSQALTNKDLTGAGNTFPTFNQNTTGSASKWTTPRNLAGNSVDGSASVAFANKFIVQGTADTGLSGAQFMGALSTGLVKNTTTTGVQSIAVPGVDYAVPGNTLLDSTFYPGEVLSAGNCVFVESYSLFAGATNVVNVGNNGGQGLRIAIKGFTSGSTDTQITLALRKFGTPTQNLGLRIETDSGGIPSGVLISANASGNIAQSSLTTSLASTSITLAGSSSGVAGAPCWIILFQGTYGSETIDATNYYGVGYSSNNTTTRPELQYSGAGWTPYSFTDTFPGSSLGVYWTEAGAGATSSIASNAYRLTFASTTPAETIFNGKNILSTATRNDNYIETQGDILLNSYSGITFDNTVGMIMKFATNSYIHLGVHQSCAGSTQTLARALKIVNAGSTVYSFTTGGPSVGTTSTKIIYDRSLNQISFWFWNGSWTQIGTTQSSTFAGSYQVGYAMLTPGYTGSSTFIELSKFFTTTFDYSTQYPTLTTPTTISSIPFVSSSAILSPILSLTNATYSYKSVLYGISSASAALGAMSSIQLPGATNSYQSGLSATVDTPYFLSNTPGGIATTPGSTTSLAGLSRSTTQLFIIGTYLGPVTLALPATTVAGQNTSPYVVQAILNAGSVTSVSFSRDNVTYHQIAAGSNVMFALAQGDYFKVSYTGSPTLVGYAMGYV